MAAGMQTLGVALRCQLPSQRPLVLNEPKAMFTACMWMPPGWAFATQIKGSSWSLNDATSTLHETCTTWLSSPLRGQPLSECPVVVSPSRQRRARVQWRAAVTDRSAPDERSEMSGEAQIAEMLAAANSAAVDGISYGAEKEEVTTRTVALTVHGVTEPDDISRLQEQLLQLAGVRAVAVGALRRGGLRGGSVPAQLELERRVPLPDLVRAVHALEHGLLALPFNSHAWMWRGHRMKYAVAGCGPPILLVHGFGGNAGHFRHLIAHLADHHRVYSLDLLGFGDSAKPPDEAYGPELWAEQVVDFLEEFAPEGAVLLGNSIGSLTALTAAAQARAELVRGLVLLNVAGAMNRKGLAQDDALLAALVPVFVLVEWLLQKPPVAAFLFDRFRSKENVKRVLQQQVYRDKAAVTDQLVDILYEPSNAPGALDVFVKVFTGDPGPRPEVLMESIDVPMLVLWGDRDPWTPVNGRLARYFKQLEEERSNVTLVPLRDVGHCPHDDRPELAAQLILPWVDAVFAGR